VGAWPLAACIAAVLALLRVEDARAAPPPTEAPPTTTAPAEPTPEVSAPENPPPTDAPTPPVVVDEPPLPETTAEALGRTPRQVKCLDESLIDETGRARARKGVQPLTFRKSPRVAVFIGGGGFGGDLLDTSFVAQGNVAFWPTEGFGFDVDFKLTSLTYRLERSATSFSGENRYADGVRDNLAYVGTAHLLFAPLHTKLRARKDRVAHADFVLFAGAGRAFHDAVQGAGFDLGVSFYLYATRFLSWRIDVSDLILATEALGSRRIANNLVVTTGVALWMPFKSREGKRKARKRRRAAEPEVEGEGEADIDLEARAEPTAVAPAQACAPEEAR
jgi:outer membrane beta-barrel protein